MAEGVNGGTTVSFVVLPAPPSAAPVPLVRPSVAVPGTELPFTGFATGEALLVAIVLICLGVLMVAAGRA